MSDRSVLSGLQSQRVVVPGAEAAQTLALGGRSLAAAAGERVVVVNLDGSQAQTLEAPFAVAELAVSPSGRFVAAMPRRRERTQAAVFDLEHGQTELLTSTRRLDLTAVVFTRDVFDEWLLVTRNDQLHLLDPSGRRLYGSAETKWLNVDQLTQIGPNHIVAIGHGDGEGMDSLLTLRLPTPTEGLGGLADDIFRFVDSTYRLNAGPAPGAAYVAFRDHEDTEDPEDAEDSDGPLWGLVGLYIRLPGEDGEVLEQIPWNGPIRPNDRLFATDDWIALAMGSTAQLVSRRGADPITFEASATAVDTFQLRLAVITAEGEATVIELG